MRKYARARLFRDLPSFLRTPLKEAFDSIANDPKYEEREKEYFAELDRIRSGGE